MMISSKDMINLRLLNRIGRSLFIFLIMLSVLSLAFQGASASQEVTLTLTSSTPSNYTAYNYLLNVTASAPITGPIKLYWTINDEGPFVNTSQMTNGFYERIFGCPYSGNWTLWLVWEGNGEYGYSQSNSVSVLGNPEGPPLDVQSSDPTMYVIVAAIGIIIAIALAFVYVRLKDKKR